MIVHNDQELGPLDSSMDGLDLFHSDTAATIRCPTSGLVYLPANCSVSILGFRGSMKESWFQHWNSVWYHGYIVDYCPFTGRVLPGRVRRRKWQILKESHGISPPGLFTVDHRIPKEFVTSEWWLKRAITVRRHPKYNKKNWKPGVLDLSRYQFPEMPPHFLYGRFNAVPPHMCRDMGDILSDVRWAFSYVPFTREFGIRIVRDINEPFGSHPLRMKAVSYCPFCGTKLPPGLKARWQEEIRKSGRDPNDDGLPDKYLSDIWWQELGL